MHYSTPAAVIELTGATHTTFGQTPAAFNDMLVRWLRDATSMINSFIRRDIQVELAAGGTPARIAQLQSELRIADNAALRIASNMVEQAHVRRASPYVSEDDFRVQRVETIDSVFTENIKKDLKPLVRELPKRFRAFSVSGNPADSLPRLRLW